MTNWVILETDANLELMSKTLGISPVMAAVLANRGIRSKNNAIKFLYPEKRFMYEAALFTDMAEAARIVYDAVLQKEKITVYGDYDADGVMSTVILIKALRALGGTVEYYIPCREEEGYGMNTAAVQNLAAAGTNLIIACDNGVTAVEEIRLAKSLGMEVVVIDHHEPGFTGTENNRTDILPPAGAVIDHKRSDCTYPCKSLCAGAMCYKFAQFLYSFADTPFPAALDDELLAFAAIATICDIVSLTDENRIIAANGLAILNKKPSNTGLKALMDIRKLTGSKRVGVFDIGFVIGPCINAAGRLENAGLAAELFITGDNSRAYELAHKLSELNDTRKSLTITAAERMLLKLSEPEYANDKVYVLYDSETPESIAGIAAGRLREAAGHPVIVLTKSINGLAKGSARSIPGYNIFENLYACRDLFERFGGHEMAAGLSLPAQNIPELRARLNSSCTLIPEDFKIKTYIDRELALPSVTFALANELSRLAPYGKDCGEPIFAAHSVLCENTERIGGDKKTLRFTFNTGRQKLQGISFGKLNAFYSELSSGLGETVSAAWLESGRLPSPLRMDIAFSIDVNEYNGNINLQIKIHDFKNIFKD